MPQIDDTNRDGGGHFDLPDLPKLASLCDVHAPLKEKAALARRLLRQTAIENREPEGRAFYSIRAVAKHFSLPPTTVARLYEQLKTEGVLGSIWGSKTIIEALEIDKDIRLRATVGLPVSLSAFSISPGYRRFFCVLEQGLWKYRFGSHLVFYEGEFPEAPTFVESFVDYKADVVVWFAPPSRASNAIARLKDCGIKSMMVHEGIPINRVPGYYVSRQNALVEGLASWKTAGIRSVIVAHEGQPRCSNRRRMVRTALLAVGIPFACQDISASGSSESSLGTWVGSGTIFTSSQSVSRFANRSVSGLSNLLRKNRVMLLEGEVDLPIDASLSGSFDSIDLDWRAIARQLVSDLVASGVVAARSKQSIFEAKWRAATRREALAA